MVAQHRVQEDVEIDTSSSFNPRNFGSDWKLLHYALTHYITPKLGSQSRITDLETEIMFWLMRGEKVNFAFYVL